MLLGPIPTRTLELHANSSGTAGLGGIKSAYSTNATTMLAALNSYLLDPGSSASGRVEW